MLSHVLVVNYMSNIDKSFIMVRPDGGTILPGIDSMIRDDGFDIKEIYHIPVWDELYYKLHERELNDRDNVFADNVKLNIWMSKAIFGNNALLLLLDHYRCHNLEELVERTFDLKFKIRDRFTSTRDGQFVIAINASLLDLGLQHFTNCGNLVVASDNSLQNFSERMTEKGVYVPAYFNYIHCPEKGCEEITQEYEIMRKHKVLTLRNRLTNREYENCKAMHSCYRNKRF